MFSIKCPNKYATIDEKYNEIVKITTNIELYCPEIESNLKCYRNIKNILAHKTNTYMINKELCKQVEYSNKKISYSEEKLKDAENEFKIEKQDIEMRENLDMLISEIEEELNISNVLWFIPQQEK